MRTADGNEHRLSTQEHRKESIMDSITTQEMAQSRIHRMRWWTLAVVSVTVVLATIDETILNVAIPSLQRDLGASASSLQWILNSYLLVFGGLLLTMGGVGDRFGRARMLRYGLAVFAISSLGAISGAADQGPGNYGCGRSDDDAGYSRCDSKRIPRKGASKGYRDMGNDGGCRRRAWTDPWRGAAQVLLLGVGVPGERADCRARDCSKPIPRAG